MTAHHGDRLVAGAATLLGHTTDPITLVGGDPDELTALAARWHHCAGVLSAAGEGLRAVDDGGWRGAAADGFRAEAGQQPGRLLVAADAFGSAATALSDYAGVLRWAQGQAGDALAAYAAADHATQQARVAHLQQLATLGGMATLADELFHDPGDQPRAAARDQVHRATVQLAEAGDRAAAAIDDATKAAPPRPSWWDHTVHFGAQYAHGARDTAAGTAVTLWRYSSVRATVDPTGWHRDMVELASGVTHAASHPSDTARSVLDLNQWRTNPGRAAGSLSAELALGAATAGVGTGAARAARSARLATRLRRLDLHDPASLRGARADEVARLIPDDWTRRPLRHGEGMRYFDPDRYGGAIYIERGWPHARDPLHRGPYVRISRNGSVTRVPLEGNPVL